MAKTLPITRERIGRVSIYLRRQAWCLSYRDAGRSRRHKVSHSLPVARQITAETFMMIIIPPQLAKPFLANVH
jgi:hypothetical protein